LSVASVDNNGTLRIAKFTAEDIGTYYSPVDSDHVVRDTLTNTFSATASAQIQLVAKDK
jgi:hypothetical protein